jgi:5-methylcytosine-specific restriction endonuclease McrA
MDTLVLNANYEVMKVVNWTDAIVSVFLDKVDVIEEYDEYIKTPNLKIKKPAVVRYKNLIRKKHSPLRFSRNNIYARDNYTCIYCGDIPTHKRLTVDHVLPRSRGGISSWYNCVACCITCNIKKADRTPKEAGFVLLNEPKPPTQPQAFILMLRQKVKIIPDIWKNYCSYIL